MVKYEDINCVDEGIIMKNRGEPYVPLRIIKHHQITHMEIVFTFRTLLFCLKKLLSCDLTDFTRLLSQNFVCIYFFLYLSVNRALKSH